VISCQDEILTAHRWYYFKHCFEIDNFNGMGKWNYYFEKYV